MWRLSGRSGREDFRVCGPRRRGILVKTSSRCRTASDGAPAHAGSRSSTDRTVAGIAAWERRVTYRRLVGPARLRDWAGGKSTAGAKPTEAPPNGKLVAKLADGPLAGCTREVSAIEGRPPKTIDVDSGERMVRYCLAEWEQSGHTAIYGFLYEV
jgi:hypothetical protein